jgi:hypothetical protein
VGRIVLAYHGCDVTTRDGLVRGNITARISTNTYDWLGDGMYFFESDPERALKLAETSQKNPEKLLTKNPIATAAVVGAVIDADRWFDLTTQVGITNFTTAANNVVAAFKSGSAQMPVNHAAFDGDEELLHRGFDRAACQMVHAGLAIAHKEALIAGKTDDIVATAPYQASRGAFEQGKQITLASSICTDSHIQIAVHVLSCIRGWFLVPGNKLLSDVDLPAAKKLMDEASKRRIETKRSRRS